MKRSWVTVKSWVKDRKPKAPSSSKRRSLSYARGHGKWLCNLLKSRALEGQAMGTRDVMSEWEARYGRRVPLRTLQRLLKDLGVKTKVQKKVMKLQASHKANRVKFAERHLGDDFGRVLFTDAHQIYLGTTKHKGSKRTLVPPGTTPLVEYNMAPPRIKVYGG
eukprot:scaffold2724_cov672-Pavlova_lutheri.AAC.1